MCVKLVWVWMWSFHDENIKGTNFLLFKYIWILLPPFVIIVLLRARVYCTSRGQCWKCCISILSPIGQVNFLDISKIKNYLLNLLQKGIHFHWTDFFYVWRINLGMKIPNLSHQYKFLRLTITQTQNIWCNQQIWIIK